MKYALRLATQHRHRPPRRRPFLLPAPHPCAWREDALRAYRYLRVRPWRLGGLLGIVALLAGLLGGCSRGPAPADQAALTRLAVTIDEAHVAGCLDAETTARAEDDLALLGVSLADADRARAVAEVWITVRPILTAGMSLLIEWLASGKAGSG